MFVKILRVTIVNSTCTKCTNNTFDSPIDFLQNNKLSITVDTWKINKYCMTVDLLFVQMLVF